MSLIVNMLWIGKKLGPVHAACVRSFVRHGHDVVMHAYEAPIDMPKGVRFFDASKLMSESEIVRHHSSGSLALASDVYRYRIQREGLGLYVDCDIYCVKPFKDSEYILAYESDTLLNPAILKVPSDSALLNQLLTCAEDPYFIPPWLGKSKQLKLRVRKVLGFPKHVSRQKWGTIGPSLLSYYVKKLNLEAHSSPADFYSPLSWGMTSLLFQEGLSVNDLITSRTMGIHLYNFTLKNREVKNNTPLCEIISS